MSKSYPTVTLLIASGLLVSAGASTFHGARADQPAPRAQYLRPTASKAPFSPAVRVGDMLYLSGQIGMTREGKLPADFTEQARQTMENVGQVLREAGSSFNEVVKCTAMLSDMSRWPDFNRVYVTYFKPDQLPARSAFGANGLAYGAMLELECTAYSPKR